MRAGYSVRVVAGLPGLLEANGKLCTVPAREAEAAEAVDGFVPVTIMHFHLATAGIGHRVTRLTPG